VRLETKLLQMLHRGRPFCFFFCCLRSSALDEAPDGPTPRLLECTGTGPTDKPDVTPGCTDGCTTCECEWACECIGSELMSDMALTVRWLASELGGIEALIDPPTELVMALIDGLMSEPIDGWPPREWCAEPPPPAPGGGIGPPAWPRPSPSALELMDGSGGDDCDDGDCC